MKKCSALLLALALCSASFSAMAQRDGRFHENGVTSAINTDTANMTRVEQHLKDNAPTTPHDNGLPRFTVVGKEHQFYLGIGAQFLGEGVFDYGDNFNSYLNVTPSTFTPSTPGNKTGLGFAWQTSSIYLNVVAMPGSGNQVGVFFKGNFTGPNNGFHACHFYAHYRNFTIGRTNSAFIDGASMPMTVDNEGPNGIPDITLFTLYYTHKFSKHISGAIGIDEPDADLTYSSRTEAVKQRIPAIPLYLQYAWDGGKSHFRLSGLVRPMQYRDLADSENKVVTGGGVQASGMVQVASPVTILYNATYGAGIGTYLQDDNGLAMDAVPVRNKNGVQDKLEPVRNLGLTFGLAAALSPKVSCNLTYSHLLNMLPDRAVVNSDQYRFGDYVAANVIVNINRFVSMGFEYDYGHRSTFAHESLEGHRFQVQLATTF